MINVIEGCLTEENEVIEEICEMSDIRVCDYPDNFIHIAVEEDEYSISVYKDKDSYICDATSVLTYACHDYNADTKLGKLLTK